MTRGCRSLATATALIMGVGVVSGNGRAALPRTGRPSGSWISRNTLAGPIADGRATRTATLPENRKIDFVIALRPRNFAAQEAFTQSLGDRNSPNYRRFLTPAQVTARFGPTLLAQQATLSWLRSRAFTIRKTYPDRLLIDVTGTVAAIDSAFKVSLGTYHLPGTSPFYSDDRNPTLPAALAGVVQDVMLDSYGAGHSNAISPHHVFGKNGGSAHALPDGGSLLRDGNPNIMSRDVGKQVAPGSSRQKVRSHFTSGYIDPTNLWGPSGYDVRALFNQGHCCNPFNDASPPVQTSIDIVSACGFSSSDVNTYAAKYGMAVSVTAHDVNGGPGSNDNCSHPMSDFETTLDVEQAVAMGNSYGTSATTAHVSVFQSAADNTGGSDDSPEILHSTFFDLWNAAYSANDARIMSMSWGGSESSWSNHNEDTGHGILMAMDDAGYSIMFAAGDNGAYEDTGSSDPDSQYPGADPAATSVGGTQLAFDNNSIYTGETAWNLGGGGCSSHFQAWSYQTMDGFDSLCGGQRSQPDIALQSGCGVAEAMYYRGGWEGVCGTSDAAPALAGITAQWNAYSLSQGGNCGSAGNGECAPLGLLNTYFWYQGIKVNVAPHQPFYDITTGSNDAGRHTGIYTAGAGYDLATGWGSFNALQMYRAIDFMHTWDNHPPQVVFAGQPAGWYRDIADPATWTVSDPKQGGDPAASGLGGYSSQWDADPGDPYHDSTPGPGPDSFLSGPQNPNKATGSAIVPVAQGCHTMHVRAWDNEGMSVDAQDAGICYDHTVPSMTFITYSTGPASNAATVQILGEATDPGCGSTGSCVAKLDYSVNSANDGSGSGDWTNLGSTTGSSGSVTWNTSAFSAGVHSVEVIPSDNAGNVHRCGPRAGSDRSSCSSFLIDRTAPKTAMTFNGKKPVSGTYTYPVAIALTAADPAPASGIAHSYYRVDSGAWTPYPGPFKFYATGAGIHIISFYSIDKAGNAERAKSVKLSIKPPPTTYSILQTISTQGKVVLGSVGLSYAGLTCTAASCTFSGIVPNVAVRFSERPGRFDSPKFVDWVVNGQVETGTSIIVTISKSTKVSAVYTGSGG